jgi:hypothetical protein
MSSATAPACSCTWPSRPRTPRTRSSYCRCSTRCPRSPDDAAGPAGGPTSCTPIRPNHKSVRAAVGGAASPSGSPQGGGVLATTRPAALGDQTHHVLAPALPPPGAPLRPPRRPLRRLRHLRRSAHLPPQTHQDRQLRHGLKGHRRVLRIRPPSTVPLECRSSPSTTTQVAISAPGALHRAPGFRSVRLINRLLYASG